MLKLLIKLEKEKKLLKTDQEVLVWRDLNRDELESLRKWAWDTQPFNTVTRCNRLGDLH